MNLMQIEEIELTEKHIGAEVSYRKRGTNEKAELGNIRRWNNSYVFIEFDNDNVMACHPEDLWWIVIDYPPLKKETGAVKSEGGPFYTIISYIISILVSSSIIVSFGGHVSVEFILSVIIALAIRDTLKKLATPNTNTKPKI